MEMTIRQLADELSVSKSTIGRAIVQLGLQDKLCKIGNKYVFSEKQILQIKLQLSKNDEEKTFHEEEKSLQTSSKTLHEEEKSLQTSSKTLHEKEKSLHEKEKSLQVNQETQNSILQEQLSILNKQLAIKDHQIQILQEQIGQLTTAMESMATALTAAQTLHAGTIQKQLTEHSDSIEQLPDQEQTKQKKGIFSRLFGRKEN